MARISEAQVRVSYALSKRVYDGEISAAQAARDLHNQHRLNINTANDFIRDYRALLEGKVFHRAMSAAAMDYFLRRIQLDSGRAALISALDALRKHITYYKNISGTNLHKMRGVLSAFSQRIDIPIDFEQYVEDLEQAVANSAADGTNSRKARLKSADPVPQQTSAVVKVFVRNPDVVAEVLRRANGSCEECGEPAPFKRRTDGSPYLEVHHRVQLAAGGEDTVANAQALCPNCHRRVHFGA